jgi:hypothetical protein
MTLTQTGGFTGSEVRYVMDHKGAVMYYDGINTEGKKLGKLNYSSRREITTLYRLLKQLPEKEEYANMTRKITIADSSGVHNNAWALGSQNSAGHDVIYNYIHNLVQLNKP